MMENLSQKLKDGMDFFVNQMPGYILIKNLQSTFYNMNKRSAALWFGQKDPFEMTGATDYDMKKEFLYLADYYRQLDKELLSIRKPIQNIHCYLQQQSPLIHFYNKSLLVDESGNDSAILIHTYEIPNANLIHHLIKLNKMDCSRYGVKNINHLIAYSLTDEMDDITLSDRQSECLFYLLRGKSASAIARVCNLSLRTIETYIDQLKNKMGCNSKSELIEKAVNKGYINVIPRRLLDELDKISE